MKKVEKKVTAATAESLKAPVDSGFVTERTYFTDTYLFETSAKMIGGGTEQGDRHYLVFDKTIFHPQGGGQPADKGTIESAKNKFVVSELKQVG